MARKIKNFFGLLLDIILFPFWFVVVFRGLKKDDSWNDSWIDE